MTTFRRVLVMAVLCTPFSGFAQDTALSQAPTVAPVPSATQPTPPPAPVQVAAARDTTEETTSVAPAGDNPALKKDAKPFPLSATVIYENSVGAGSFVSTESARRPFWEMSLSLRAYWQVIEKLKIGLRLDIAKEVITNAETDDAIPHQTKLSDMILSFSSKDIWMIPKARIHLGAFTDLLFPTSLESRFSDQYLAWRLGTVIWGQYGPVKLTYTFRFAKNFNRNDQATINPDKFGSSNMVYRDKELLGSGFLPVGTNNLEWGIMNDLAVEWEIYKGLALLVDFAIFNSWTYVGPRKDQYAAAAADGGRGQRDLTWGQVEISYQIIKQLGLALGVLSYQPPKSLNNEKFRVPFFNFEDPGNNFTTVYLDVVGTF